jgi:hypothetical protein
LKKIIITTLIFIIAFSVVISAQDFNPFGVFGKGDLETVKNIVEEIEDINKKFSGMTPIMWAAFSNDNPKIIEYLLDKGADPLIEGGTKNKNAIDLIKENKRLVNTYAYDLIMNYSKDSKANNEKNNSTSSSSDDNHFRNAHWGMSIQEVKNVETQEPIYENNEMIVYEDYLIQLPVEVIYLFVDNKLTRAKYSFIQSHTNENDFISDYKSLNNALKNKYGKPNQEDHFWSDDLYKDSPSDWGFAVSLGHHSYFTEWDTSDTEILSALYGDNYKITMVVEYYSKELKDLEEEKINQDTQSKL